jgi:hypothetical protein
VRDVSSGFCKITEPLAGNGVPTPAAKVESWSAMCVRSY